MKTPNLTLYARSYKKMMAYAAICEDLKPLCLDELNKTPEGKAVVDGVEFHLTQSVRRTYPKIAKILKSLTERIKKLKKEAIDAGEVKISSKPTFDAEIPKSTEQKLLSSICPQYAKRFRLFSPVQ